MSFQKKSIILKGQKYSKIEIITYHSRKDDIKFNSKQQLIKATKKCIKIISKHNQMSCKQLLQMKSIRIYCPLHEQIHSSKTKSGQLFIDTNRYICYSNKCLLPMNSNGNRLVSTKKFLEFIKNERNNIFQTN